MIRLPEIKTAELNTCGNFAKCHQAHFRVLRVGLGTRLFLLYQQKSLSRVKICIYKSPHLTLVVHEY